MLEMMDLTSPTGAEFSTCRKYRYALWRIWDRTKPPVMFIGLNPSTANEQRDDPTIRRVITFAKAWGNGGVFMMNCYPYVSAYPDMVLADIYGARTDPERQAFYALGLARLQEIGELCPSVVFAWGTFPIVKELGRDRRLMMMFPNAKALVINKDGSPRHPLYVRGDTVPVYFDPKLRETKI